jgi:hypothetical protein
MTRRSPELRRLDRLTPAERKAELDALAAEALASDDPRPPAPTVEQLVAREVERQRRAEAEAAELAESARYAHPAGSGCAWCGRAFAVLATETGPVPDWHQAPGGTICGHCVDVSDEAHGIVGEAKVTVARRLLGVPIPLRAMGDSAAFETLTLFFAEHEGAEPSWPDGWQHVDLEALRVQWDTLAASDGSPPPDEPAIETFRGQPCETCRGVERFVRRASSRDIVVPPPGARYSDDGEDVVMPGECVDCVVAWMAQASGSLPGWWIERRGKRLPSWAKPLVEAVPA